MPEQPQPVLSSFVTALGDGEIAGFVFDRQTIATLPGANVVVSLSPLIIANTNSRGEFLIRDVPPATYDVKFRRIGYIPRSISVSTKEGRGTAMSVSMDRDTLKITDICITYLGHGIRIRAVDARTHQNILPGSVISVRDGNFSDMTAVPWGYKDSIWPVEAVGEREGNYDIIVSRPGYKPWMKRHAVVFKAPGSCHVSPILLEAKLAPSDG